MKGTVEESGSINENRDNPFDKTEEEHLNEKYYDLITKRRASIEVTGSSDNTKAVTVYYPSISSVDESDDEFIETESRMCRETIASSNGLCTVKVADIIEIQNKINEAIANIQADTVRILSDIMLNNVLDEWRASPNESDVACAEEATMAVDSQADIWEDTSYDKSPNCVTSVPDIMKNGLALRVVLTKSALCERRIVQKKVGSLKSLFVVLERSDLVKIQEGGKHQRKSKKKWQRRYSSEETRYRCKVCPFKTSTKFKLLVHADEHEELAVSKYHIPARYMRPGIAHNKVLYKCLECKYTSEDKWVFSNHLTVHKSIHEVVPYRCAKCPFKTKIKDSLAKHMEIHKSGDEVKLYRCPHCSFVTCGKIYIARHIKMLHETETVELLPCNICGFKTKYERSLRDHMVTHIPDQGKRYKCPLCPFATHKVVLRNRHMLRHVSDEEARIFGCANCDYKAKTKDSLRRHLLTHMTVKMYKCTDCSYETNHKNYLSTHHQFVHQPVDKSKMQPCSHCPYQAKSTTHLRRHLRHHKDPKDCKMYKCDRCSYQSLNFANVTRHKLVHMKADEVPWHRCDSCDYVAKTGERLKAHFNTMHRDPSEIKWYACDQCGRKFKAHGNLKRHRLVHLDSDVARTFRCQQCPYLGKTKSDITEHMAKHLNVYIECNQCSYKTKFRTCMWHHKKKHQD